MKSKELMREAVEAGAVLKRRRGDHHIYEFPDGSVVAIPHGGTQNEVSPGVIANVRRAIRRCA